MEVSSRSVVLQDVCRLLVSNLLGHELAEKGCQGRATVAAKDVGIGAGGVEACDWKAIKWGGSIAYHNMIHLRMRQGGDQT